MVGINEFKKAINDSKKAVLKQIVEQHKAVVATAYNFISSDSSFVGFAYGSPVWSGSFIRSHNVSIGAPDPSVDVNPEAAKMNWPNEPDNVFSPKPASYVTLRLMGLKPFEKVFVSNNLPYAEGLEEGKSPKAPEGIYMIAKDATTIKFKGAKILLK